MVTYQRRPTQLREVQLVPDIDLTDFLEGTPLSVSSILIPESGTGFVAIESSSLDATGLSVTCEAGQYLRLTDAPGAPLELALVNTSLADNRDYIEVS